MVVRMRYLAQLLSGREFLEGMSGEASGAGKKRWHVIPAHGLVSAFDFSSEKNGSCVVALSARALTEVITGLSTKPACLKTRRATNFLHVRVITSDYARTLASDDAFPPRTPKSHGH